MKLTRLSKADFGSDDPYFNLEAARKAFEWVMKSDPGEVDMVIGMAASETVSKAMRESGDKINEVIHKSAMEKLELVKKSIQNGVISKSMSDDAANAASEVIKAFSQYTTYERAANADKQKRGPGGRFAPMGRSNVKYSRNQNTRATAPTRDGFDASVMSPREMSQYANAYREVATALDSFGAGGEGDNARKVKGIVTSVDSDGNTRRTTHTGSSPEDFVNPATFRGDDTRKGVVTGIDWYSSESNPSAGMYYSDPTKAGEALRQYSNRAQSAGEIDPQESRATRNMRHIANASDAVNNSGATDRLPDDSNVKRALDVGRYVGEYGPEAEKVLGPSIRRSAYRYRGVEKTPDSAMIGAMSASTRGVANPDQARDALMKPKNIQVETGFGLEDRQQPSPFIQYWQGRLPDVDLVDLHVNSGAIAPSEGTIINRKGEVVTQAVGYGDDHYLPFNLSKLGRAKGGEYVRTRTVGGPTTEDIYAGLMSGSRAVTVVSHSGVYQVEFDKEFRGGRRYNDKAARMMKRYGMLTDSLASNEVQLQQIPPDRKNELRRRAEEEVPGDTPGVAKARKERYQEFLNLELTEPKASQEKRAEWTGDFILEQSEKVSTADDGYDMTPERLRTQLELKNGTKFETDEEFIDAMGKGPQYEKYMEHKENEYRQSMKPLNLNGQGYHKALLALKEQFPYYISEVRYIPNQDMEAQKKRDKGYVKPKHLRSDKIKTGYFDRSIEGYDGDRGPRTGKRTGKRSADAENYSNYNAQRRYAGLAVDDKEGGPPSFSGGGSSSGPVASSPGSTGSATPGEASSRDALTYSGIRVVNRPGGSQYTGFKQSKQIARGKDLAPFEQVAALAKVREGLSSIDQVTWYENNTKKQSQIWSDDPNNTLTPPTASGPNPNDPDAVSATRVGASVLLAPMPDSKWVEMISTDDNKRKQAIEELKAMRGQKDRRSAYSSIYRSLEQKGNLVTAALGDEGERENPKTVRGVTTALANGDRTEYDFTNDRRDGIYYLPGLTQREYIAAWNSDQDIQGFMASSEKRFGYRLSMEQEHRKFRGMTKDFGKAMNAGLDQADQWDKQIIQYGSPRDVPSHQVVKYGAKNYSIYATSDLRNDIAKDALSVAKMKQLYEANAAAKGHPDDYNQGPNIREISVGLTPDPKKTKEVNPDLRTSNSGKDPSAVKPNSEKPATINAKPQRGEVNEEKLEQARQEIDSMVGISSAKREFDVLIQDAQIAQMRSEEGLKPANKNMHLVFTGEPGTGKTTYAKSLAKSYNALGILPTDKVVVATRADLVGEYTGQTAPKTRAKFDEAKGGVLFIDEAYALNNGEDDTFGKESIDEIVALSEERRGDTVVILAGYPGDTNELFKQNSGLKSRFPRTIKFPNFNKSELSDIAHRQANNMDYEMSPDSSKEIARVALRIKNSPNMSNARDTRNFIDEISRAHTMRISSLDPEAITREELTTVRPEDVKLAEELYFKERTGTVTKRLVRI